ncbi:MAG: F0F1 ATP synthase subunit B [Oscillospiraceae bacterium]|nr:F0F1 ATP synthase subunit B [Oscillospiraceae bacterium]MBQ6160305.1 F0F1 ATP synthase subunit B [Oscillospiraceae bacterium]
MTAFENFIGFNPWTALFTLLNLVLTFLILKKFLFKPVNKMIDDRQKEIDELYADANAAKQAAETLREDYDRKISEAKDASAQIIAEATQEAHRRRDDMIIHAQSDADAIREKARADIELERKKALNSAKDDISRIALDIAEKVVGRELNSSDHDRMVEDFLRHMEDQV